MIRFSFKSKTDLKNFLIGFSTGLFPAKTMYLDSNNNQGTIYTLNELD